MPSVSNREPLKTRCSTDQKRPSRKLLTCKLALSIVRVTGKGLRSSEEKEDQEFESRRLNAAGGE